MAKLVDLTVVSHSWACVQKVINRTGELLRNKVLKGVCSLELVLEFYRESSGKQL